MSDFVKQLVTRREREREREREKERERERESLSEKATSLICFARSPHLSTGHVTWPREKKNDSCEEGVKKLDDFARGKDPDSATTRIRRSHYRQQEEGEA